MARQKCDECSIYTIEITPEVLKAVKRQKGEYDALGKPAGSSIEKTINEMLREWVLYYKNTPVVLETKEGDYQLTKTVTENERLHIIDAVNKKTDWIKL